MQLGDKKKKKKLKWWYIYWNLLYFVENK